MPLIACRFKSFSMSSSVAPCTQIIFTLWTMENITHAYTAASFTFITSCSAITIRVFCAQFKSMAFGTFACYLSFFSILIIIWSAVFTQIITTLWTMEKITHAYTAASFTFITSCSVITIRVFVMKYKCMIFSAFVLRRIAWYLASTWNWCLYWRSFVELLIFFFFI